MFQTFSIKCIVFSILINCLSGDLQDLCGKNSIVRVKNAFKLNDTTFLSLLVDGITHPIRVDGFKFVNQILKSDSVKDWKDWNRKNDDSLVNELIDFHSVIRFTYSNGKSPLIFLVRDPSFQVDYLLAHEIEYDTSVTKIESVNTFHIDPYRSNTTKDVLNLRTLFENFPSDYQWMARPVVSFPINDQTLPKRAFVYYNETKSDNNDEDYYGLHIMVESETVDGKLWIHDIASGECIEIDKTKRIDSAIAISDYSSSDHIKKFDLIEFYQNGNYDIKSVSIDSTDVKNTSVSLNSVHSGNIREIIICDSSQQTSETTDESRVTSSLTTSSDSGQDITAGVQSTESDAIGTASDGSSVLSTSRSEKEKKENYTIYVVLVVVLLLMTAVVFIFYLCLKHNNAFDSPQTLAMRPISLEISQETIPQTSSQTTRL